MNTTGTTGNDTINGGIFADTLIGLAGEDYINASWGADRLEGGDGNDTLVGGTGNDTMIGGKGNDRYYVDSVDDVVIEDNIDLYSDDTIYTTVTLTALAANVENAVIDNFAALNLTGNALANTLVGNDASNVLSGLEGNDRLFANGGNDTLIGGEGDDELDGGNGNDSMSGGNGNDTYFISSTSDIVSEAANGGTDTIYSYITIASLTANVENGELGNGSVALNLTGNSLNNKLKGNDGVNVLLGLDGDDSISGQGGNDSLVGAAGNDTLDGGAGNDTLVGGEGGDVYFVDSALDVVVETGTTGTDSLYSTVSQSLNTTALSGIEIAVLTGSGNVNLTGNAGNNNLFGNGGDNVLDGGTGNDSMYGSFGNDTYYVDSVGDYVYESQGLGTADKIVSTISIVLNKPETLGIENVTLLGTAALNATGNDFNNILQGNDGNNVLDGGLGEDTLAGGKGNDTYFVNSVGDVVLESVADGGTSDTVFSSVSMDLSTGAAGIEILQLTGLDDANGIGNALNNLIQGNAAYNELSGGAGADTLYGNGGYDFIQGGAGTDWLYGGDDGDNVMGGDDNDLIFGGEGGDDLFGDAGNDLVMGENGDDVLFGGAGDDSLYGGNGSDQFEGGAGNDSLIGGLSGDVYFAYGAFGADVINDVDSSAVDLANHVNVDELHFSSASYNSLWFKQVGANLEVSVVGTANKVTVQGWFNGAASQVEQIYDDVGGHLLNANKVAGLVTAMAGFTPQDLSSAQTPAALVAARDQAWTIA